MASLDSVIHYRYRNGTFDWVKRQKFTYDKYVDSVQIFRAKLWASIEPILIYYTQSAVASIDDWRYDRAKSSFNFYTKGLNIGCMQLKKTEEYTKDSEGNILKEEIRYHYDNPNTYTANRIERLLSDGSVSTEQTLYAEDYGAGGWVDSLVAKNIVSLPIEKIRRRDGQVVSGEGVHLYRCRKSFFDGCVRVGRYAGVFVPTFQQSLRQASFFLPAIEAPSARIAATGRCFPFPNTTFTVIPGTSAPERPLT
ncbi:MAG: hypothetical protein ACLR8Y_10160 [Alistipes indistinctus]